MTKAGGNVFSGSHGVPVEADGVSDEYGDDGVVTVALPLLGDGNEGERGDIGGYADAMLQNGQFGSG